MRRGGSTQAHRQTELRWPRSPPGLLPLRRGDRGQFDSCWRCAGASSSFGAVRGRRTANCALVPADVQGQHNAVSTAHDLRNVRLSFRLPLDLVTRGRPLGGAPTRPTAALAAPRVTILRSIGGGARCCARRAAPCARSRVRRPRSACPAQDARPSRSPRFVTP